MSIDDIQTKLYSVDNWRDHNECNLDRNTKLAIEHKKLATEIFVKIVGEDDTEEEAREKAAHAYQMALTFLSQYSQG